MNDNNRYLRQWISLFAVMVIGVLLVYAMRSFITPFLSALIFYVMLQPLVPILSVKWKLGKTISALFLMAGSFIIILLPIGAITWMLASKVNFVLNHSAEILNGLQRVDSMIEEFTGFRLLTEESLFNAKKFAAGIIPGFVSRTADVLILLIVMYFILYFLLTQHGVIEKKMIEYLPFSKTNNALFVKEMNSMVMSNLIGTPLLAFAQGLFAWLGYVLFGLPEPLFWAVITALFAFLPLIGTPLVWIPAGLFQITAGYLWPGVGVLVYGAIVISNIDNVFRFIIQKKLANIHPLVTILGVLMGIKLIGLPGIIFGPLSISWFLMIVKIYRQEFHPQNPDSKPETSERKTDSANEKNTNTENQEA